MASEVGTAYVTLIPSAKGFASKMQSELGGDLARYGQQGGDTYSKSFASGGSRGLASRAKGIFGGLAKAGAVAAVAAGAVVGKVLSDSIAAASDMGETLSKAGQIFGQQAVPGLERFAEAAATNLGQSKQQALDAASTFAVFGKSAGLAGDDLVGFSTDFTTLASDMASFHNATPQEAIDAIGAALRGEAEPMRRFGVLLDDASMRAEALRLGLVKNTKEALTPQQKVLAAQALIFKQTGDAQGDFARTSGGLANQQRILSAQWENAKVQIGKGLLPVALKLVTWANDLLPRLGDVAQVVKAQLAPAVDWLRGLFQRFSSDLGDSNSKLSRYRQAAVVAFQIVRDAMAEVVSFVQAEVIPRIIRIGDAYRDLAAVVIPKVRQIVDGLLSKWGEIEPQLREIWGSVKSIITNAMTIVERVVRIVTAVVQAVWEKFGANIVGFLSSTFSNVVQVLRGAFQIVQGIFKTVAALLKGDWKGVWEGIKLILRGAWNVIIGLVKQGWNVIKFAFQNAGVILKTILSKLWSVLKSLVAKGVSGLISLVKSMPRLMLSALQGLGSLLSGLLSRAWDAAKNAVTSGVDRIMEVIQSMPGKVKALAGKFLDAAKALGGKIIDGIKNGLTAVGGVASDIASGVASALESIINSAVDAMNSAIPNKLGWGKFAIDIDDSPIPHVSLATGGRVTGATVALIGEGREPETVLPDSMLRGLLERTYAGGAGGMGLLTITNWKDGTGYFRIVADDAQDSAARYSRHLGAMNA